jgi:hypothetical protein
VLGIVGRFHFFPALLRISFFFLGEEETFLEVGLMGVATFVCGSEILTFGGGVLA